VVRPVVVQAPLRAGSSPGGGEPRRFFDLRRGGPRVKDEGRAPKSGELEPRASVSEIAMIGRAAREYNGIARCSSLFARPRLAGQAAPAGPEITEGGTREESHQRRKKRVLETVSAQRSQSSQLTPTGNFPSLRRLPGNLASALGISTWRATDRDG
jgi:hypothetical protein